MADRYLLEGSGVDGYQLEDGSGVLLLEGGVAVPDQPLTNTSSLPPRGRRRVAIATLCASLAFVPLVAAASDAAPSSPQGAIVPARTAAVHVQTLTGPVLVPAAVNVVTLDEWYQPPSQPPRRRTSTPPATGGTAPLFVPDVTTPAPPLSWLSGQETTAPAPRPRIGLPGGILAPEAPAPPVVEPLDWLAPLPQPGPRRSLLPKDGVEPIEAPAPPAVAPLDWLGQPSGRPSARPPLVRAETAEPIEVPAPVVAPDVATWAPSGAARAPERVRLASLGTSGAVGPVEPVAAPPASTDQSPAVQGGDILARPSAFHVQTLTGPVVVPPPSAPAVALDWLVAPSLPPRRVRSGPPAGAVTPPRIDPVVAPSVASWLPAQPAPSRRRRLAPLPGGVLPPRVDVVVVPSVASWAPQSTPPRRRRLGPPDTSRVAPVRTLPAETITIDKWAPVVPARPWPRRRLPRGWDIVYPLDTSIGFISVPSGNLWEDIASTPGGSPFGTPTQQTGGSPFETVAPSSGGTSPFDTPTQQSGASLFGTPASPPAARSPWDDPS